jgi:hypothetical protein
MFVEGRGLVYTQPLFDTINLAATATGGTFFAVPRGGAIGAAVKDARHTNLVQAGRLEPGNELQANAISMHVRQSLQAGALPLDADVRAVYSGNVRILIGGQTEFLTIPAQLIPAGGADFVFFSNITPAATEFYLAKGVAATQNKFYLDEPLKLESQETITVILENCDAITAATHVTFVFWGTALRPVR